MTKKVLSAMAAAAIMSSGALAYEASDLSVFNGTADATVEIASASLTPSDYTDADAMIFPAFYAGGGFTTTIRVVNTDTAHAVVAKVVFFEKDTSKEIKDFNIYLSASDVWTAKIVEENGKYYLISTDSASPLPTVSNDMASADNPLKIELPTNAGYFEILKSVIVNKSYHNKHKALRTAYKNWASSVRASGGNPILIGAGIFKNTKLPHLDYVTATAGTCFDSSYDGTVGGCTAQDANVANLPTPLYAQETIVNANSGLESAMTIQPYYFSDTAGNNAGLVYLEGEKANAMDIVLERNAAGNAVYLDGDVVTRLGIADINTALVPYKDQNVLPNNKLLITSPFKRVLVEKYFAGTANVTNGGLHVNATNVLNTTTGKLVYAGIKTDANGNITNFGAFKAYADIYNNEEAKFNTVTFSPALPSFLTFTKEVQSTEATATKLSDYINKAIDADASFANGGYAVVNFDNANFNLYAIPSLMTGTYVNGHGALNWVYPATNVIQ